MTTNHIDQLAAWYVDAERVTPINFPLEGDTIIYPVGDGYTIVPADDGWAPGVAYTDEPVRILHRAPEPKPAWHDAVAVIAATEDDDIRRAFVPQYHTETGEDRVDTWADWQGAYGTDDLIDPTPLIEAKVTDSMVLAAINASLGTDYDRLEQIKLITVEDMRKLLHAALGIDPE